jgi:hypothetical protein
VTARVEQLQLRLRIPEAARGRVDGLRRSVEQELVVRVLEQLERELHARMGPRAILRIRHLPATWRLGEAEVAIPAVAERLGRELAEVLLAQVAATPGPERLRPRAGADQVCFEDEAHAAAVWLSELADGMADGRPPAWFLPAAQGLGDAWRQASAPGPAALREILVWLERMDAVAAVLAATEPAAIEVLLALLPPPSWPAAARRELERLLASGIVRPGNRTRSRPADGSAAGGATGEADLRGETVGGRALAVPERGARDAGGHLDPGEDAGSREQRAQGDRPGRDAADPRDGSRYRRRLDGSMAPEEPAIGDGRDADAASVATEQAGLFYLIGRVLELDLAEHLWCAGLAEGNLLCHIAAALLGDAGPDPAWRYFGGAFDHPPLVEPAEPWAIAEASERIQHALGLRLVRFGVAATPASLEADLSRLAAALPPPAAPTAPLPAGLAPLVARSAAALLLLTCARLGEPPLPSRLRALAAIPGTLSLGPEELLVRLPAAAIDVDVRRAGLDRDPGHVPWLHRRLRLEFTGAVEL